MKLSHIIPLLIFSTCTVTVFAQQPDSIPTQDTVKKVQTIRKLDQQPEFPGGRESLYKYIGANFQYPKFQKPRPKGTIHASFVVDKDGSISDVKITRSVQQELDAEAVRVLENMPKWKPGMQDGKAVRVRYNIPIKMS